VTARTFVAGLPGGWALRITVAGFAGAALGLTIVAPPAPRLVWNASASAPVGLYWVRPRARLRLGDLVIVRTPRAWRAFAAVRHYLPANVPLVKRVAAMPGDRICARGPIIQIEGVVVARRLRVDAAARSMPWWEGCRTLGKSELFLLMADAPGSFDGRYFGPSDRSDVIGRARLLWAR
jgi:conjugative transfer signal peptidase TraF